MVVYRGVGVSWLMTLLFMGLKLGGAITWSWWWVFAPLWGPVAFAVVVLFLIELFYRQGKE